MGKEAKSRVRTAVIWSFVAGLIGAGHTLAARGETLVQEPADAGVRWYATAEFLLWDCFRFACDRPVVEHNSAPPSPQITTGGIDFNYQPGIQATLGIPCQRPWCSALEVGYLGVFNWNASATAQGPNNLAVPGDMGYLAWGLSAAETMQVDYAAALHSGEINAVKCWSDCGSSPGHGRFETLVGFRYLALDEAFQIVGRAPGVVDAMYRVDSSNDLYGVQLGGRYRWTCRPWSAELAGKAGIYGNDANQRQRLVDELGVNDFTMRDAGSHDAAVAFVGELGVSLSYQFSPVWALRGGYRAMWIDGVSLACDQLDFADSLTAGTALFTDGGLLAHGVNLGLEARW